MEFTNNAGTSSPAADSDDISLFLRQLLRRSSPSPSAPPSVTPSSSLPSPKQFGSVLDNPPLVPYRSAVFCAAESSGVVLNSSRCFPAAGGCNLSSASESLTGSVQMRSFENEADEYDCDSEEGPEAVVDGVQLKQALPRNSSKRSRAAEVHNLSEKRRRSRINEKMKALQNLIPNSNKTDKASMLDEAIEYLKQLQLQVQMLSMRNGLSLHPLCLPGAPGIMNPVQLSQLEPSFDTREGAQHTSMSNTLSANPEAPHNVFNLPDPSVPLTRPSVQNASGIINSGASFGLGSSFQAQFGPFQSHGTSEDICREDDLRPSQLVVNSSEMSSLGTGNTTPSPLTFKTQESHVKDSKEESLFVSSNYNRLYARNSAQSDQLTARR